jgi:hypothetical protein
MSPIALGNKIKIFPESSVTISLNDVLVCVCVHKFMRAYVHARTFISLLYAVALFREIRDTKLTYGFGRFFDVSFRAI